MSEFAGWLEARRPEIEGLTLARVFGISADSQPSDPDYLVGMRSAISAAFDYGVAGLEWENERNAVPALLLAQARRAARGGISLDTVLGRYVAGYSLFGDLVFQAIEEGGFSPQRADLRRIWRIQTALLESLVTAVATEYSQEVARRLRTADERRAEHVKKLLLGSPLEPNVLSYDFDAWHIGIIARGSGAREVIQDLAKKLDRRLLLVCPDGASVWAWLGGRRRVTAREVENVCPSPWPAELSVAVGEPEQGVIGWRLTHRQAKAAAPIASQPIPHLVRYGDVALLATALRDEVLASSLERMYLDPLALERDGGMALRRTLAAYLESGRNASSAAAALGVSRQTVNSRLRVIEERIGHSLGSCAAEVDTALRLHDLRHPAVPPRR